MGLQQSDDKHMTDRHDIDQEALPPPLASVDSDDDDRADDHSKTANRPQHLATQDDSDVVGPEGATKSMNNDSKEGEDDDDEEIPALPPILPDLGTGRGDPVAEEQAEDPVAAAARERAMAELRRKGINRLLVELEEAARSTDWEEGPIRFRSLFEAALMLSQAKGNAVKHYRGKDSDGDAYTYTGLVGQNGKFEGLGMADLDKGHVYIGQWKGGHFHGVGLWTYSDGVTPYYLGEWRHDAKCGHGTEWNYDGDINHSGEFEDNWPV